MGNLTDHSVCWQVEAACAVAWPTSEETLKDGWAFRRTPSTRSRRINAVNPTEEHGPIAQYLIDEACQFFTDKAQDTIFRVPAMVAEIDKLLDQNGFGPADGHTKTLLAPELSHFERAADVDITAVPSDEWLEFALSRAHFPSSHRVQFREALLNIGYPILFGQIVKEGELAAIAYCVVYEEISIIESVETMPQYRRQGKAARLVGSLLAKSRSLGATKAALQVMTHNDAARQLYQKLGFSTELYDYHYRTKKLADI